MVKIPPFVSTSKSWPIAWPRLWFMLWNCAEAAPSPSRSDLQWENVMRIIPVFLTLALTVSFALAQQSVPPPPQPANDASANAEVLMLLRAAMPESVVLDKIHAITGKFDSSTSALITDQKSVV